MPDLAILTGIAVLTQARPVEPGKGSQNLLLDANFFAFDDHADCPSLGLLRYYNVDDVVFGNDPVYAHVVIHVAFSFIAFLTFSPY